MKNEVRNSAARSLHHARFKLASTGIASLDADSDTQTKATFLRTLAVFWLLLLGASVASAQPDDSTGTHADESAEKTSARNFVIVPIPMSNPTLGTGLILGGAYFHPQSAEEAKVEPASVTAAGGMYSNNGSTAFGIGQQTYWGEDTWRFSGGIAFANLELELFAPGGTNGVQSASWLLRGGFVQAQLSRKVKDDWYVGLIARYIDADQSILPEVQEPRFDIRNEVKSAGLGLEIQYDARDMPYNTYDGRLFKVSALFNEESLGSDRTYQTYRVAYRSYHEMSAPLVLAWEVEGCLKTSSVPLWDACFIELRGFSATKYLGKSSASAQFEARWRLSKKWGLVGFAGAGFIGQSFTRLREKELIPSYGIGLRFMVLPAKRINMRIDYGFSTDSNAIHLSVGESF